MKKNFTRTILFSFLSAVGCCFTAIAQTPTTPGVVIYCSGSIFNIPATPPTTAGTPGTSKWILRFSPSQTATPGNIMPETLTAATAPQIGFNGSAAKTGYYYLSYQPDDPTLCESEAEEIITYVFQPLSVDFTPTNFCIANTAVAQVGNPTSTDTYTDYAYQWYNVDGAGTETAIAGANTKDYTPTATGTYTYKLRIAYAVGTNKYCDDYSPAHTIKVDAKPTAPTITVTGAQPVTF
jgi:hypothetical protein